MIVFIYFTLFMKRGFNMSRTLCDLPLGDLATISHITAPPAIKKRFMDMGGNSRKGCTYGQSIASIFKRLQLMYS